MKFISMVAVATLSLAAASAASAADTNVALTSSGASFVSASSYIGTGNQTVMQNDVISTPATRTGWYGAGYEDNFIFGGYDNNQTLTINLGQSYNLTSVGATFSPGDRPVTGPFSVQTSSDGINFSAYGSAVSNPGAGSQSLISGAVTAQYVQYSFGPASQQYGSFGGSRVVEVFANTSAAPEPAAWALMMVGVGGMGAALRTRRRKAIAA